MHAEDAKYKQLVDCSCTKIRKSARMVTQLYDNTLREAGIKQTQFTLLAALANTGPIAMTQLADLLALERTGLTRNLNVLQRQGWITVESGVEDTRQRIVTLSEHGFDKLDQAIPYWQKAQQIMAGSNGAGAIINVATAVGVLEKT